MRNHFDIWQHFTPFRSTIFTKRYLTSCYEKLMIKEAKKRAYENCYPFLYYLDYSEKYFKQTDVAPMELHPILLFYGMTQLLKACILTQDPDYPSTSQVLAHGVSTRKRKKMRYSFLADEVKIQKQGLFAHFSDKMFHVKHLSGEKYKMRQLLRQISELHPLFSTLEKKKERHELFQLSEKTLAVSENILNDYQLGFSSFQHFFLSFEHIQSVEKNNGMIYFELFSPLKRYDCAPFMYDLNGRYYLSAYRGETLPFPEIIIHYLLLYNLSMICRYETEWWSELFHYQCEHDFPFIETFLKITKEKIPLFVSSILHNHFFDE